MELIFKAGAAALTALVAGILIKKSNPELASLLSICTVCMILFAAIGTSDGFRDLRTLVKRLSGSSEIYIAPIMKCLGISLVTRISSDLCKDMSQSAAASALEMTGALCAFSVVSPILLEILKLLGGLS